MSPRRQQHATKRSTASAVALRPERQLHQIAATVLRLAKERGVPETEVHIDESIQALTRFANNTIHQNVAEQGMVVSIRTAVDGRTARVTTNRVEADALRAAIDFCEASGRENTRDRLGKS